MSDVKKAAGEHANRWRCPISDEDLIEAFEAGAAWQKKQDLLIWKHPNHTYCDFYYEGLIAIDPSQKPDWWDDDQT